MNMLNTLIEKPNKEKLALCSILLFFSLFLFLFRRYKLQIPPKAVMMLLCAQMIA